jgi:hypothetical protein
METTEGSYYYKTGFKSLDKLYPGGFVEGSLNVIVGGCCSFKTTVVSQFDKSRTLRLENIRINSDNINESISDIEDVYIDSCVSNDINFIVLDGFNITPSSKNIYEVKDKLFYTLELLARKYEIPIFITEYTNRTLKNDLNEMINSRHLGYRATTITNINRKGKLLRIKSIKNRYGKLEESFCYYSNKTLLSKPQWLFKLIYKLKK